MRKTLLICCVLFLALILPTTTVRADEESTKSYGEQLEQEADQKADDAAQGAYDNANSTIEQIRRGVSSADSHTGNKAMIAVLRGCYRFYVGVKAIGGYLTAIFWLIGVLMFVLCRKNKKMQRIGLYGFGFILPALLWAFIVGIGSLNGIWLHNQGQALQYGDLYLNAVERFKVFRTTGGQSLYVSIMDGLHTTLGGISTMTPILITIFEAQGLLRIALCKYDTNKRNLGLYGYCIAVPVMLVVVSVGVDFLGGLFR